jgi:hypothetical protein
MYAFWGMRIEPKIIQIVGTGILVIAALVLLGSTFYTENREIGIIIKLSISGVYFGVYINMLVHRKNEPGSEVLRSAKNRGFFTGFIALFLPLILVPLINLLVHGTIEANPLPDPFFLAWVGLLGYSLGYWGQMLFEWKSNSSLPGVRKKVFTDSFIYLFAIIVLLIFI